MLQHDIAGAALWPLPEFISSCGAVNYRSSVRVSACNAIAFAAFGPLRNACLLRAMTVVRDGGATGPSGIYFV